MAVVRDEFALIRQLTESLPVSGATLLGVGDDCAILRGTGGSDWLVTTDMLVEDVHFRRDTISWPALGAKALTCGLSDVAAMGGSGRWAVVNLGVPKNFSDADAGAMYEGLCDQARRYRVDIVGGDTVCAPHGVVIGVTLIGVVDAGMALRRSAAEPGDAIVVTGRLGDAAAGLDVLLAGDPDAEETRGLVGAHQWPVPRCEVGVALTQLGTVHACIDLSDGLAGDLHHVCAASEVGAVVDEAALPLSAALQAYAAQRRRDPLDWALGGGEDYELLFTMPARAAAKLGESWSAPAPVPLTVIGAIEAGPPGVRLRRRSGAVEPMPASGFDHFAASG